MKDWLKKNILGLLILVGIVALIVIILFQKKPDYSLFEYQLKQARDSAKLYQPTIDSLIKVIAKKDETDYAHSDSLSNASIEATNKILYELKKQKQTINIDTLYSMQLLEYFSRLK